MVDKSRPNNVASKSGIAESIVGNWDIGKYSPRLPIEDVPKLDTYNCILEEMIEAVKNAE